MVEQSLVPVQHRFTDERIARMEEALQEALPKENGQINVTFVKDDEIRRLNRMYRGKDAVTDVLSFTYGKEEERGDVAIAFFQAQRQAEGDDVELECVDLLFHGVLHVLGYDHEQPEDARRMFPLQDKLVNQVL